MGRLRFFRALFACAALALAPLRAVSAADCPGDGSVRMGLIPSEDTPTIMSTYKPIADQLSRSLGCPVHLTIATSYSATIEAMRSNKLDFAMFGPLSYVLAHKVADAEAIAVQGHADGTPNTYEATIVTPKSTGITTLRGVAGHSFAFSDPASTSGHLMPAYALRKAIRLATVAGSYDPSDFVTLWRSEPLPGSPIAIRGDLPPAFQERIRTAVMTLDLRSIPDPRHLTSGTRYVPVKDSAYDGIRDMVSTLGINLEHISE